MNISEKQMMFDVAICEFLVFILANDIDILDSFGNIKGGKNTRHLLIINTVIINILYTLTYSV